ncbi:DHHW family protein [Olleya sp. YS]|uniref:DHHW family protein n=1 Tax=Olleya sp. YS TaxID=3028318 RepID=UPI0024344600|nr:DHHW family protein [Olleya sp. YS]WGD35975.1 DHHW family protein [Olleya sp. YS]
MKAKDWSYKLFIIVFLTLLIIPNIVLLFGLEQGFTNNENIEFETPPEFDLSQPNTTLKNYKSYYLGNYGLKKTLVNQYVSFKSEILKENPLPDKVVVGNQGWYFLGNAHKKVLNNTFNTTHDKIQIVQVVKNLKKLSEYLREKNILFYVAVAPNKHSIYKENLPYKLNQNATFYEELIEALKDNNINYINLHKVLLEKKKEEKIYYKTDTHWNNLGAFYAYQDVINTIGKELSVKPLSLNDYIINTSLKPVNHLSKMINVYTKEQVVNLTLKKSVSIDTLSIRFDDLIFSNQQQQFKLLMSRDSFSDAWIGFFNESFNQTRYIKNYNPITTQLIEQYKPDVVIYEIVERNLPNLVKPILLKNP